MINLEEAGEVRPRGEEIGFTTTGKILLISVVFLYAQAYALNNLTPALFPTLLLAYVTFARLSFDSQLGETSLKISRHAKIRAFQDKSFPTELEIYNQTRQAVWLKTEDQIPIETEIASGQTETTQVIEPQTSHKNHYMLLPIKRGKLILDKVKLTLMDERGLMQLEHQASSPLEIDVEPPLKTFRAGELLSRKEYLTQLGTSPSRRTGRGYDFSHIRQYVPEDAFTTIEWKASSRLAKLMTKLNYEETRNTVYIFLDASRTMRSTPSKTDKSNLDQSLELAVRLITHLSRQGSPVGIGIYDEHRVIGYEPPKTGYAAPAQLLRATQKVPQSRITTTKRLTHRDQARPTSSEGSGGFLSKILPFFGRKPITPDRATGIYHVVERLVADRVKTGTILIFSDLTGNPRSITLATRAMTHRGHRPVIVTPLAPSLGITREELTVEILEDLYTAYTEKKELTKRLERMGAIIIQVDGEKPAEIEVAQRLSKA